MATIIIQGKKEETNKAVDALKQSFNTCSKKATLNKDDGLMTVVEVELEGYVNLKGYTDAEVLQALNCCSMKERNCKDCPLKKESDCVTTCLSMAHVVIHKMHEEASKR